MTRSAIRRLVASVLFCHAARAAGAAPVRGGDPGYGRQIGLGWDANK